MDAVFERAGSQGASPPGRLGSRHALRQAEVEHHAEVAQAIAPLIVKTIKTEIRGSQDELAEALYPAMGRMVRSYVVSAFRDLTDEINRRLEANRFMLRVRSLLTGRPIAELALAAGRRQKVEEIYLIRRGSGELVSHWPQSKSEDDGAGMREHTRSGILAAINDVTTEAFVAEDAALRRIDLGSTHVYLRASPAHLLAVKCTGTAPPTMEQAIDEEFIAAIERLRAHTNGVARRARKACSPAWHPVSMAPSPSSTRAACANTAACHRLRSSFGASCCCLRPGQRGAPIRAISPRARAALPRRSSPAIRRCAAIPCASTSGRTGASWRCSAWSRHRLPRRRRSNAYARHFPARRSPIAPRRCPVASTKRAPISRGCKRRSTASLPAPRKQRIATLDAEQKRKDIDGLRAELERVGGEIARRHTDTLASLDALRADLARLSEITPRQRLEQWARTHAIFFDKDSDYRDAKVSAAALDELADLIKQSDALVRVVGHTDEKGGQVHNAPLSLARARKVADELTARGVPAARLVAVGRNDVANLSPATGDASPNRRVEFEIGFDGEQKQ
jgi:outer membrane protein OmpA-like peptidoglycan-associated protein